MDKYSKIKMIKLVIRIYLIFFGVIFGLNALFSLLTLNIDIIISNIMTSLLGMLTLAGMITIIFIVGIMVVKFMKLKNTIRFSKKDNLYNRNLPDDYGPAIASILLDIDIEIHKDYTATIINLCSKKYLKLIKNEKEMTFKSLEKDLSELLSHELYVYDCVLGKKNFDDNIFRTKVVNDAKDLGLIQNKVSYKFMLILPFHLSILFIIVMLMVFIPSWEPILNTIASILGSLLFLIIVVCIVILIKKNNENYHRTPKGKKDAISWKQLKQFIKDFSAIKEKPIEYVTLLEYYLAYAISLGEAKEIEKYIGQNNEYRSLIYHNSFD